MNKIGIIADTACDLTKELLEKNNIKTIPFYVNINGKEYLSGRDISVEELFKYSKEHKCVPKTSQISMLDFIEKFEEYLKEYDEIIYIGLSSKFSGTYNNARLAKEELESEYKDKIHIIDSHNLSSGIGLLLLKACKLRDLGKSAIEIVEEVNRCIPLVRTQFAINTLDYLHWGGRCSGTTHLFGSLLRIKPIIKVVDGGMMVAKKPIGKFEKALKVMLDMVSADKDNIDPDNVMVTHCLANDDAKYLKEKVNEIIKADNVHETFADVIVSAHCGPRTIGILYILNK